LILASGSKRLYLGEILVSGYHGDGEVITIFFTKNKTATG
jgi:hypothetical protein